MRGLSVALIEAQDLASGTSSRSSKMIHGGLRYLVAGDVAVVKESASERATLHRIAPHLAQKTPYVIPTGSVRSKLMLRAALWAYERLGGVERADYHEVWSRDELAEKEPLIERSRLNGAVVYPEFLTDDSRLTVATVRSAIDHGATVATYLKATNIRHDQTFSVEATSTLPGENHEVTIQARAVVNAAGPWVDQVCGLEQTQAPRLALSRGVHLVFDHADLPVRNTVVMRTPDARRIFAVPLGHYTYIGTTDDYHPEYEYWPPVTDQDVSYLLATTQRAMPAAALSPDRIVSVWSGIRPLVGDGSGRASKELSRKDEVWTSPSGPALCGRRQVVGLSRHGRAHCRYGHREPWLCREALHHGRYPIARGQCCGARQRPHRHWRCSGGAASAFIRRGSAESYRQCWRRSTGESRGTAGRAKGRCSATRGLLGAAEQPGVV